MRARYFLVWLGTLTAINLLVIADTHLTLKQIAAENATITDNIGQIVKILHWEMERINGKSIDN